MNKHLWQLDLESIPLGWQEKYDNALKQFPDGMPLLIKGNKFFAHPRKYKELLVLKFNEHKEKAIMLNNINVKDSTAISELLESDIILFNVLFHWLIDGSLVDDTFFDINKFNNPAHFIDTEMYFHEEDDPYELISHYYSYKFFQLNNLNNNK